MKRFIGWICSLIAPDQVSAEDLLLESPADEGRRGTCLCSKLVLIIQETGVTELWQTFS
jgi:hypothetical protein